MMLKVWSIITTIMNDLFTAPKKHSNTFESQVSAAFADIFSSPVFLK